MQKVTRQLFVILTLFITYIISFTSVVNSQTNSTTVPVEDSIYLSGFMFIQNYFLLGMALFLVLLGIALLTVKKRPSGLVKTKIFHY
jgi:hypothetical protein